MPPPTHPFTHTGFDFLLDVFNAPPNSAYLEALCGIAACREGALLAHAELGGGLDEWWPAAGGEAEAAGLGGSGEAGA